MNSLPVRETAVLAEDEWQARRAAHTARVRRWTDPHHERKQRGEKHPVLDFLFSYYSHRPARLERWHPGPGVVLAGESALEYLRWPAYTRTADGVTLDTAAFAESRRATVEFVHALLTATATRQPRLGCFGLHEWAMVYRQRPDQVRHNAWPLRLGGTGTDAVVESASIRCGHFDAFRFFTQDAAPRNTLQPTRATQVEFEQPGCLHAGMDLFKWSYKLDPATPSELVADCFELAVRIRELDMQASPYDLATLGYRPVRVETERGRAEYVRRQAAFAEEGRPLRQALIDLSGALLAA
ncbi:3-methyladenine DNA glycosylase [Solihabitans fulvus]|uniref:3-methyladenine DNA glycosylase n=1 Tax=Solihabitans fulvus TaxID=1892852 RepID=A0A5B2WVY5_9PSEU|nr:3-methyladenine DNA glycosylase [Solihabitans fulvus]KAA2254077.1 3-methyladenine DNA glycosylase [Solihabitans fulvus]